MTQSKVRQWRDAWSKPVDGASLGAFRSIFGFVMCAAMLRFMAMGWVDSLYNEPRFHFSYYGLSWIRPGPPWLIHAIFGGLSVLAAMIGLGVHSRLALALFTLGFAYVDLLDAATYLNHYYAVILFGALLAVLPCDRAFVLASSVWRTSVWPSTSGWPSRGWPSRVPAAESVVPLGAIGVLRLQLAIIYFFAGVAKLQSDWLLSAEPLRTWLLMRSDTPVVGALFEHPETAFVMSWAGAIFDLSIPFLLVWRRTRGFAYLCVLAFHLMTAMLFRIGVFPWLMMALTPIYFEPSWPRDGMRRLRSAIGLDTYAADTSAADTDAADTSAADTAIGAAVVGRASPWLAPFVVYFAIQLLVPLRHHLYPGDVLWTSEGMRWSWQVMIAERAGWVELRAVDEEGRTYRVDTTKVLTPQQVTMMAIEPDLLIQYAHHVRDEFERQNHRVRVYADVFVSVNGRPSRRLVDPEVDLASEPWTLAPFPWLIRD